MNMSTKATYMCTCERDFRLIKVIKQFIYSFKNRSKLQIANRVPLYVTLFGHVGNYPATRNFSMIKILNFAMYSAIDNFVSQFLQ